MNMETSTRNMGLIASNMENFEEEEEKTSDIFGKKLK